MISHFPQKILNIVYKPKWLKQAIMLEKAAKRLFNYKRDLIDSERASEIKARIRDLRTAISQRSASAAKEAGNRLEAVCDTALPRYKSPSALAENVEVFFVAIVIALGIRAYILQPFRIPTGSMQPTLNGISGQTLDKKDWPSIATRMTQMATRGRTYVYEKLDSTKTLANPNNISKSIVQRQSFQFFTFTDIFFSDGSKISVNAPRNVVLGELGLGKLLGIRTYKKSDKTVTIATTPTIPAGTILVSGYSDSGDLILVDKVSYHFRTPTRGEVFVFDTRGIRDIHATSGPQGAGSHYIKRLAGIPGDTLSIGGSTGQDGHLYINGRRAQEHGFQRVADDQGAYKDGHGYVIPNGWPESKGLIPRIGKPGDTLVLKNKARPLMQEYAALGDNTTNSLDSRYWGSVKEYNIVGNALFALWPFTTGHWGLID